MAQKLIDDVCITVAGRAGQGIQSVASLLSHILKLQGYHTYTTSEYMSRVRGGMNSTTIRVSTQRRDAYRATIDLFVPLDKAAFAHCAHRFAKHTMFLGVKNTTFCTDCVMDVDFASIARTIGNPIFENTVAAGAILGVLETDVAVAQDFLRSFFVRKGEDVIAKNTEAITKGFKIGAHFAFTKDVHFTIAPDTSVSKNLFMNGSEAIGFGALAAGCDFYAAYPMSPSTDVLAFLAQRGKECAMVVEQATDEIEAINMALGASYAGARAMVGTSGGGFDLMCESVSLAGMTETPVTIFIGMRPGPATGLPTRTGQEDANLVIYAGHGEFMRAVFAPATVMQAYELTAHALVIADVLQVPTFILADQFFLDGLCSVHADDFVAQDHEKRIVESHRDYVRYALTENGISERSVPGYGDGVVCVGSDEHDEAGRITEDMRGMRVQMTQKRLAQRKRLLQEMALPPEVIGKKSATTLVVCWGSNRNVVAEAVEEMDEVSVVSFTQIYPLPKAIGKVFAKAQRVIVVENNATGQFARLLTSEGGVTVHKTILKATGEPFSVEELRTTITSLKK